jgi:hypothetical protein
MTGDEKRAKIIAQQAIREAAAVASAPPKQEKKRARRNWTASAPRDRGAFPPRGPRPAPAPKEE